MPKRILITGTSTGFGRYSQSGSPAEAIMYSQRCAMCRVETLPIAKLWRDWPARKACGCEHLELDVTDQNSVDGAIAAALEEAGDLDVVINNAGIAALGVTEAFTPDQFEQIFAVNVSGVVRVNRAVLPTMRRRRSGPAGARQFRGRAA